MKALYRRAATNAILAKDCEKNAEAADSTEYVNYIYTVYAHDYIVYMYEYIRFLSFPEAQEICSEAKADLLQVIEAEPQNKEARAELKAVQVGRRRVVTCI